MSQWRQGVLLGLLSAALLAVMTVGVRSLDGRVGSSELVVFRATCALLALSMFLGREIRNAFGRGTSVIWVRSVAAGISRICLFWNLQNASIGLALGMANFSPAISALAARLVFNEKIGPQAWVGIGLSVGGTVILSLLNSEMPSSMSLVVGMIGAFAAATAQVSLRRAAIRYPPTLVTWGLAIGALVVGVPSVDKWVVPTTGDVLPILVVCATGLAGQLTSTMAFARVPTGVAATTTLSTAPFVLALEFASGSADITATEICGLSLVLSGACVLAFLKGRERPMERAAMGVVRDPDADAASKAS